MITVVDCFQATKCLLMVLRRRLLLNGVVNTMQDKLKDAEMFFEAAVTFEPQSILAWTMFGSLFCMMPLLVKLLVVSK